MSVYNSQGEKQGILLINYTAAILLDAYRGVFQKEQCACWLLNQDGYWLKGTNPEEEFGFMFGREDLSMAHRYSDAWKRMQAGTEGQFETATGLWTFYTVHPLMEGHKSRAMDEARFGFESGSLNGVRYEWKAVYFMPMESYNAGLLAFDIEIAIAALVILALFFAGIWQLVRAQLVEERMRDSLEQLVEEQTQELRQAKRGLAESNIHLEQKVDERTAELARANEALVRLSRQDALTGLANRLAATERLRQEFLRMKRSSSVYAVLMMDIDFFKHVNDAYGHAMGDDVLRHIAQILNSSVRETDFVARYGGEEFIAFLPDTSLEDACRVGEKIRQAIEA